MKKTIILILLLFFCTLDNAQNRIQFVPITDSIPDISLQKFIDTLKVVIKRKDHKKIYKLIDANIVNGFELQSEGIKNFKQIWQPHKKDELWNVLSKILSYGGQYVSNAENRKMKSKNSFVYPYFFDKEIENQQNYFDLYVVDGTNVNMHMDANTDSKRITTLGYEVVKEIDTTEKYKNGWILVQTLDGSYRGYIKNELLYNFIDYRMFISRKKGIWKINILVAGD